MNTIIFILASAMPLIIVSLGALYSEYAGRMVFFLDGLITMSAFICYAVAVKTGSFALGIILCMIIPAVFVFAVSFIIEKFKFNSFIASLSQNIFLLSLVTAFSAVIFKTRGVLTSESLNFSQNVFRFCSVLSGIIIVTLSYFFLHGTKKGLYLRITGSDSEVLENAKVKPSHYRILSWVLASLTGSVTGVLLLLRLSSFVPNISSGIGWTSLAIVFLGKKDDVKVILMALVFSVAQYLANNIQNVECFKNVPSALLLALPYLICLLMLALIPHKPE
ncbi:ABC transporter permease subunit [Treponema sp.]|uniref:ABC transporter permease subunit n=1 Tax=Treponema sp. TaxID=166 RepID=UPI00298E9368|nr:ABC transporter permease [Treponema sp.]